MAGVLAIFMTPKISKAGVLHNNGRNFYYLFYENRCTPKNNIVSKIDTYMTLGVFILPSPLKPTQYQSPKTSVPTSIKTQTIVIHCTEP